MSQLLHRTRTYASFSMLFFILPIFLFFPILLITSFYNEGFSFRKFVGLIFSSACCYGLIEVLFHDFKVIEFYADKLIIRKPLKRKGIFRKGRNEWILFSSEWEEAFHFSQKHDSTIYFRKDSTAIFALSYSNGGFIIDKFKRYFPEKNLEMHSDRKYPSTSISNLKKNFPDCYVN